MATSSRYFIIVTNFYKSEVKKWDTFKLMNAFEKVTFMNLLSVDVHYYKERRADSLKVSFYTNISSVSTCVYVL